MIGQTVSHYRVEEKLGEGGMGVVYRAVDTRLGRSVALKALAPEFARDPNRRKRFQQEARAAATLTHPGIATVYALEEVGDDLYIVSEYVRGQNLRGVIGRGVLAQDDLLDMAIDIAQALAAAHTHGIVHRDIKPENILRTPEGDSKILDFGLARFAPASLDSATRSAGLTDTGSIVGTVAYMSPEQLEAKEADFRSDIFSFGVLLYELATGARPFEGSSVASTISRILTAEPVPLLQRNPVAPAELDRIVRKCLRKRPEERYQSTKDLVVDLDNLRRDSSEARAPLAAAAEADSSLFPRAIAFLRPTPRRWWEANQLIYVLFNALMIYIGWTVREWTPGTWGMILFLGVVVCAATSTALRVILLGTAILNPTRLPVEMRGVFRGTKFLDLTYTGLLFVVAATIAAAHLRTAGLLIGFAVAGLVAFLLVDPTLIRTAFPELGSSAEPPPPRPLKLPLRWPLAVAVVAPLTFVVLVGLNVGGWRERLLRSTGPPRIQSLAVLPLENLSGDPEQDYFADGMTEALIGDLAQISSLRVISRTSVMQYKGVKKPLPEIARELNVDAVIEGSVQRQGNRVKITAQLIEATTDRHLWAESYERDLSDILALQDEVARAIADQIKIKLTPQEQARLTGARPVNPEAHEAYLKGRYYWNKRTEQGLNKGIEFFQRAIDLDPTCAPAYAGLADSYNILANRGFLSPKDGWAKAEAAAQKALAMDDSLGEAHASLAFGAFYYDWDWLGAEREFKRAIELNPNYAPAHHWYSHYLIAMGRKAESLTESQRALELDPLDLSIAVHLGWHYYIVRQYDQAIRQVQGVLEMDPNLPPAHIQQGLSYEQKARFEEAIAEFQKAVNLAQGTTEPLAMLGHAYAVAGKRGDARKVLEQLKELSKQKYVSAFDIAVIYAGLGEKEQAFAWLEKAYEQHSSGFSGLVYLEVDPRLDPLRSDPRFQDLLRRMNLPQ